MAVASTAKFHQNFWGEANAGFDVLMNNMKAGISASKELGEFIKERITTEEGYVKGLTKLYKSVGHVPLSSMGAFGPLWEVLKAMCDKLVLVHSQFVKMLTELSREISEYHHSQKEKYKGNVRGEIDQAQESLNVYQATESAVHRCKKHYQHCVDHLAKIQGKVERAKADGPLNPKLSGLEARVKQEQAQMETAKGEYQAAVAKHCDHVMEHQGKMSEACTKFESLEEEHLAQMFTFMIKIARTQDTMHVGVAEQFSTLNSQLDVLTVEKLLKLFVEEKGTGTEKPTPLKFRPIPVVVPTNPGLSASLEDITAAGRQTAKTDKKAKKKVVLGKKPKNAASNGPGTQSQAEAQIPDNAPNVDEEGYSIRPQDAASIPSFPDEQTSRKASSDSDSDFDDAEPERKIKMLKIRDSSTQPVASVDDIKASMMSLRLGAISPLGMKKATSSQSLNILTSTPPSKMSATNSSHNLKESAADTSQPGVASLIDIDMSPGSAAPQMPAPLLPAAPSSKGGAHNIPAPLLPTTSSSTSIRGGGSQIPAPLVPSVAPIPAKRSQANPSTLSFDPKSIDTTASLPVWNLSPFSKPSPFLPGDPPAILPTDPSSNSPLIPRPRAGSLKSQDPPVAATTTTDPTHLSSIPAPSIPSKRRSAGSMAAPISSVSTISTSNSAQISALLLPTPASTKEALKKTAFDSDPKSKSVDSSPVFGRKNPNPPDVEDLPPVPTPRTASLMKSPLNPSPTHLANPVSPLATSQISAHHGGVATGSTVDRVMPLAVAINETCNAIFKGTNLSQCMVQVTGEVVMSFPASYLQLLGSYEPLTFKVEAREKVERVLHNQVLLQKLEDSSDYTFHMDQLSLHLRKMQEKASAPFYNIQVLKYDVGVSEVAKLPLHLVAYMKCSSTISNFRLDYTYQPGVFQTKPTMTKVAISLPMDGGVQNSITKPTGSWSAEAGLMTWAIGDVPPSDNPMPTSLHAKFGLSSGPSTVSSAVVSFTCEGDTVSGLSLDLTSAAYKLSLLKKKCLAGKYVAEPKVTM